ncbi:MAG: hypothetical protein AB1705_09485 [Verrucomicrobiota bacterium]
MLIRAMLAWVVAVGLLFTGCKGGHDDHDHDHGKDGGHERHHHDPPHGGTGVTLGDEDFHLEFLREDDKMTAWILAAHMSGFTRIKAESFEVTAKVNGKDEALVFKAVANPATGETVGNTSMFQAQAEWLKSATNFDAVVKEIIIKDKTYKAVPFNFPKGN